MTHPLPRRVYWRRRALVALIPLTVVASTVVACGGADSDVPSSSLAATNGKPPCEGDVVTVEFDAETDCDVIPPQRLDVTMSPFVPNVGQECSDMGGMLRPDAETSFGQSWVCEDVDY